MIVRSLRQVEIPAVLELWKKADSSPSVTDTVADISRVLEQEFAAFLVAEIEGTIVGSIIATFDGWRGIVYRLAVHPDHRRKGIALELTRNAEAIFARWGVRRVIAIVDSNRPSAMNFWKAAGYQSDGMIRFYRNL